MSNNNINLLTSSAFFSEIDASFFPEHRSLESIIANDCEIKNFQKGDIIIREGDYGTSAYVLISGNAWYLHDKIPDKLLGRKAKQEKKNTLSLLFNLFFKTKDKQNYSSNISKLDQTLNNFKKTLLEAGDIFGETSGRDPRSATIVANEKSTIVEIKWQGVRDLRKYSPEIRELFDALYRARSLEKTIKSNSLFSNLTEQELNTILKEAILDTKGDPEDIEPEKEKEIISVGAYVNGLTLIRSGFAKVSNKDGVAVKYLSRGDSFGISEIYHNNKHSQNIAHQTSLTVLGYLETIFIPKALIEKILIPKLDDKVIEKFSFSTIDNQVDPNLLNFLVTNRLNNGRSIMMIDLERCTRCNDCTDACAITHDNVPRFTRNGKQHDKFLIAQSCMHCLEPYCMNSCPTGAIYRDERNGEIVINEETCIGCANCSESCIYNNISMLKIGESNAIKASKCDLCIEHHNGPACERSCPTEAIKIVNLSDFESLKKWAENH